MTTTTIPTDSTNVPSRGRRYLKAAAGVAAGATLGWFASSTINDDPVAVERATAVAETANVVATPIPMSPDAMTRWAETDTASVVATPIPMSPDAMTRWAETDTANVVPSASR